MLIFVYGSLMRGQSRDIAQWLNLPFIGEAEVNGDLYAVSWFPAIKLFDDLAPVVAFDMTKPTVQGEVFEIPTGDEASIIAALDRYEGCPSLFTRRKARTSDNAVVTLYEFTSDPTGILVTSGSWREHNKIKEKVNV